MAFHYLDLRTFCYDTESEDRVLSALDRFLPPRDEDDDEIKTGYEVEKSEAEGHYGNTITVFETRLELADEIRYVMNSVRTAESFSRVLKEIEDRIDDDCSFYVRFDKQAAYEGEIRLGDGITLRGKVEAYPAKKENAVETVEEYFSEF